MLLFLNTKLLPEIKSEIGDENDERRFLCASCKTRISGEKYLINISGDSFNHTFTNPHGAVFNIITLSYCESVVPVAMPTDEHTWFSGYSWMILCCANCYEHLGWQYESTEMNPTGFFALIKEKVETTVQ